MLSFKCCRYAICAISIVSACASERAIGAEIYPLHPFTHNLASKTQAEHSTDSPVFCETEIADNESAINVPVTVSPFISEIIGISTPTQNEPNDSEQNGTTETTGDSQSIQNDQDLWSAFHLHPSFDCEDAEMLFAVDFLFDSDYSPCSERVNPSPITEQTPTESITRNNQRFSRQKETAFIIAILIFAVSSISIFLYIVFNDIGVVQMVPWKTTLLSGYVVVDVRTLTDEPTMPIIKVIPF